MTKRSLTIHLQTIHMQSEANVTPIKSKAMCNDCDKTFVHKHHLIRHIKNKHNGSKTVLTPIALTKNHISNTSKIIDGSKMLDKQTKN